MTDPTLAVLITYYNERELLTDCLRSVLDQSPRPREIIVYDDASAASAREFIPEGAPVRLISGERNIGPGGGRNVLLRAATSDYVHFQDADDLLARNWSSAVLQELRAARPDIVFTEIRAEREGAMVAERVMGIGALAGGADPIQFGLRGSLLVPSSTFRRLLALQVGGFHGREVLAQSEDFEFHLRLLAAARSWRVIDQPLIVQRLREGSHSSRGEADVWRSAAKALAMLADELPPLYRPDVAEAAARVAARLYALG
ncbi:MAG TPA: glycosyltransferase family 2 protein, partial [Gemmatimonadaceae bacterium]|nr:glycosyltransferase family 2 protein [Gemmatimonadaceae bacterium]